MKPVWIFLFLLFFIHLYADTTLVEQKTIAPFQGEVRIETWVNLTEVPMNDSVLLAVKMYIRGNHEAIELFQPAIPEVSNFTICGSGSSIESTPGERIVSTLYYLKPKSIGMGYIEPIKTGYQEIASGLSETMLTQRLSIKIIESSIQEETSFALAYILLVGLAFIGGLGFWIYRKKSQSPSGNLVEGEQPNDIRATVLNALKDLDALKYDPREKVERAYRMVLQYLRDILGLSPGVNGRAIVEFLRQKGMGDSQLIEIQDFFDQCEMINYSANPIGSPESADLLFKAKEITEFDYPIN